MSRVLTVDKNPRPASSNTPASPYTTGTVIMIAGCALAFAGWLDVLLIWFPADPSDVGWEFGSISATFDSLPLGTLALVAILLGLMQRDQNWPVLILTAVFWLITVIFLAFIALYALSLPVIIRLTPAPLAEMLKVGVAKTSLLAVLYLALYAWLGWFSLHFARARRARA